MPLDTTSYLPPGVYIEEQSTPIVPTVGVNPTSVALIGTSRGYIPTSEVVTLTGTDAIQLGQLGIDGSSVVVRSLDGLAYTVDADYTLTVGAGEDSDSEETLDNTLTITRIADGDITDGQQVRVTYQYTDEEFYEAKSFTNFEDVKDAYGEPLDTTTGAITSPLSLAAKIAFENGARELVCVATEGSPSAVTRDALSSAYTKIAALYNVGIVVPLPVGISGTEDVPGDAISVATDLESHVVTASEGNYFRIGIIGHDRTVTIPPEDVATAIGSQRVMYAYPSRLAYYNGFANQVIDIDGCYLAAAYAGRLAGQAVEMPLTKKAIRGFSGLPASVLSTMTATNKNIWSDAGVAVTELARNNSMVVRHGTTTDRSSTLTREVSIVRAKDALVRTIQDTIDAARIIGTPIRENTVLQVKGVVQGALEGSVNSGIIVSYQNLLARLQPGDPQVIEVKFEYRPAYPLNYVLVTFSIDTSSGGEIDFSAGITV